MSNTGTRPDEHSEERAGHRAADRDRAAAGPAAGRLPRLLVAAPDAVVLAMLVLCFAVTVGLMLNTFTPWLVLLVLVVALPLAARFVPPPPALGRADVLGAGASLLGAALWAVLNLPYAAQLLWVTRDPAIYTVTGIWLGHHHTGGIDGRAMIDLQNQVPGVSASLIPFSADDSSGVMHGQGGLTLPGLMGVGGWIGGIDGALRANIVVGAVALVGVYALARRFVRPWLALVAQAALGLAVAFLYLMRAPYSESILLLAGLGALVWFVAALRSGRVGVAVMGGLLLGVGTMARIDGPMLLAGSGLLVAFLGLVAATPDLARVRRTGLPFLAAGVVSCLFGLLSMHLTQRRYVNDLHSQATMLWAASVACLLLAVGVLVLRGLLRGRWNGGELPDRLLGRAGLVAGAAVPVVFAVWWSRPWWWHGHFIPVGSPYEKAIANWQQQLGLHVDGTQSYDELTLRWVAWYFGIGTVVLAAVGLGLMLWRGIARRDLGLLVLVVPTAVAAMLYFNKVSVTPDQTWAYRRLLPIITPGLIVGAVYVAEWWLSRPGRPGRADGAGRPGLPGLLDLPLVRHGVAAVVALVVAAGPLLAWSVLVRTPEDDGVQPLVERLCDQLTGDGPVLVANGHAPINIPLTVRSVCGKQAVSGDTTDADLLRRLEAKAGRVQVVLFTRLDLPKGSKLGRPNVQQTLRIWQRGLIDLPDDYVEIPWKVWVGHLEDGRIVQDRRVR